MLLCFYHVFTYLLASLDILKFLYFGRFPPVWIDRSSIVLMQQQYKETVAFADVINVFFKKKFLLTNKTCCFLIR